MRRNRLLLSTVLSVLLCASLILSAKAEATMWTQTYGGSASDIAYSLVATSDGGYALAGYTGYDFWLVKTDQYGNMEWNKTYGGDWPDIAYSLVATSDGGYAIAGYTESFAVEDPDVIPLPHKPGDFWLIKTDAYGNVEWNQTYGGKADEHALSLVATSDGGYALVGGALFVKTDEFGNMEWNQTYEGYLRSLVVASDGGYVIAGYTSSFGAGEDDFWLVKTDAFGNVEWNQTYGGIEEDLAYSLVATSDGGYALAGSTYSFYSDFWLVKTDEFGNVEWNQTYGGTDWEYCKSLVATSDGGYALAGSTRSFGAGKRDFWLVKTDVNGNMQWNQTCGGTLYESAYSLVATSDGGYAIAGGTYSFGAGNYDFWLVKTDETGMFEPSPTPTATPTSSPLPSPTATPSLEPTPTPTFTPEPTSTPYDEPQPSEQDMTVGVILAVTSIAVFLGLLFYFIKRG